jgi:hypothetical protein
MITTEKNIITVATPMTMSYELITPERARYLLTTNNNNRNLSPGQVTAFANDMKAENWDLQVASAIAIDENGVLRDGQHRLVAIARSNKSIPMWVCRNVSPTGIYDNNRKRTVSNQMAIMHNDYEKVYKDTRIIGSIRTLITKNKERRGRTVTPKEVMGFIEKHKTDLDKLFLSLPSTKYPGVRITTVLVSLFMAYMAGVRLDLLVRFYEVLVTGMAVTEEEYPIIAYRNYLLNQKPGAVKPTNTEISRCQYAIKKYVNRSCCKLTRETKELIYPFPYEDEVELND